MYLISFLLCGVIAATAIAGAAFYFMRKHSYKKDKLSGLKQPDFEASKDYQVSTEKILRGLSNDRYIECIRGAMF